MLMNQIGIKLTMFSAALSRENERAQIADAFCKPGKTERTKAKHWRIRLSVENRTDQLQRRFIISS